MAAPVGNQFWLARSSFGEKAVFKCPEDMWKAACEYFVWCQENPLWDVKLVKEFEEHILKDIPKVRPFTIGGLTIFLGISTVTFYNYRKKKEYINVTKSIEEAIRDQKFTGAATGFFNANIIARDLGLRDHVQTEHSGYVNVDVDPEKELKNRGIPVPDIGIEDLDTEDVLLKTSNDHSEE